jgi:hypothetical protein
VLPAAFGRLVRVLAIEPRRRCALGLIVKVTFVPRRPSCPQGWVDLSDD